MDLDDSRPGRSSKGKLLVAAAVVAAGVAAWWMFGRGKGEPEDPARVLIVGPSPELVAFLDRRGFDPEHLSYGDAVGQGQAFDAGLDDVAAIVEFADQRGFGYVALDLVHRRDYAFDAAGYEVDAIPAGSTFAVIGVGKLADVVSFGGIVEAVHHEPVAAEQVGLLLALFGQPELAKARSGDAINDLMIRFGASRTLEDLAAYEQAQTTMRHQIAAWEALRGRERGEASMTELARPYEPLRSWPLADGSVLLAAANHTWRSPDGERSEWSDASASATLSLVRLDAPGERTRCSELPDTLPFADGIKVGPRGDALLIPTDFWLAQLWVREGEQGCGFVARDPIRRLGDGEFGKPIASGRTAEAIAGGIEWADAKLQRTHSLRLPGVTTHAGSLAWLSDELVVVAATIDHAAARSLASPPLDPATPPLDPATLPPTHDALLLVRLPARGKDVPPEFALLPIAPGFALESVWPIAPVGGVPSALIGLRRGPAGAELVRFDLVEGALAWTKLPSTQEPGAPPWVPPSEPASFTIAATLPAGILSPTIDRAGRRAAWTAEFEQFPGADPLAGHELVLLEFGQAPRRLGSNEFVDLHPRFAGPGDAWLVFDSTRRAAEDLPPVTTVRAVALE